MDLIHTCYRITDPEQSIAFYGALGLEKRRELPIRGEAISYFLGVPGKELPELELTYNFGVDSYEIGTGYGHVALTVDDIHATLNRLKDRYDIEPERAPYSVREGGSLIAFVKDPDRLASNVEVSAFRTGTESCSAAPRSRCSTETPKRLDVKEPRTRKLQTSDVPRRLFQSRDPFFPRKSGWGS